MDQIKAIRRLALACMLNAIGFTIAAFMAGYVHGEIAEMKKHISSIECALPEALPGQGGCGGQPGHPGQRGGGYVTPEGGIAMPGQGGGR